MWRSPDSPFPASVTPRSGHVQFPVMQAWWNLPWRVLWPYTVGLDSWFLDIRLHSWYLPYQ
jgi:hypothetical protein